MGYGHQGLNYVLEPLTAHPNHGFASHNFLLSSMSDRWWDSQKLFRLHRTADRAVKPLCGKTPFASQHPTAIFKPLASSNSLLFCIKYKTYFPISSSNLNPLALCLLLLRIKYKTSFQISLSNSNPCFSCLPFRSKPSYTMSQDLFQPITNIFLVQT